ncbi:MAG TPA: oxalate/formate MFS antiporter [Oxalicibacterium sp.]|nr:oxalate/formate MFS antiporter [Oxalicibacterium sp.]
MNQTASATLTAEVSRPASYRWMQLILGIIAMAMIANLQYGWTLFVDPISQKYGWSRAAIQVAFTIFVITETWLVPIEGWFVDKFGPRPVVLVGGILCGLGWFINSFADSLALFYVSAIICGVGAGAVYGTCVGNALKWFPDRRGLAAGLTAAGFGAGSAATIIPISSMIAEKGYEAAFLYFGIGQGIIVVLIALFLTRAPEHKKGETNGAKVQQSKNDFKPSEVLRQPVFWIMYVMFVMVAAGGLMATAQLGSIAHDFKVFDVNFNVFGMVLPALTFALAIDSVLNGLTRPFFGWISDMIGREPTMFIAFAIEAVGILALYHWGHDPIAFVILTGIVFFAWGEIYSLFPSTCADTFGAKFATANSGLLYTAKGTASLLVPISAVIASATGGWYAVFVLASILNAAAALMAWFVLKPMRSKFMSKN